MPLPEDARLMADGIEVPSTKNYMIDRNGTVYAYIEALDAAVESEILIACVADGQELPFCPDNASRPKVITLEAALKELERFYFSIGLGRIIEYTSPPAACPMLPGANSILFVYQVLFVGGNRSLARYFA